jgi:hypothetical protein
MEQNYDNLVHVAEENAEAADDTFFQRLGHLVRTQLSFKNVYMRLILLRLPSIIFADFILMNSEQIINYFYTKEGNSDFVKSLVLYTLSRFSLLGLVAVCLLLFVLNLDYVLNTYKCITLVSLPFLFTFLMDELSRQVLDPTGSLEVFAALSIPKFVIICLIYALVVSLTISVYHDIYKHVIFDKFNVHAHYLASRENGNAALVTYLESLANVQYEGLFSNQDENNAANPILPNGEATNPGSSDSTPHFAVSFEDMYNDRRFRWFHVNKRRIFIISYSILSLIVNELPHLFTPEIIDNSGEEQDKRPFNIMSLGYLILLTYDLGVNMDQMLLRCLIKIKILSRLVSQYGLPNFLTFNWFQRLRVPFLLRVYFLFRTYLFTLNFIIHFNFYVDFNAKLAAQNLTDTNSLYVSLVSTLDFYNKDSEDFFRMHPAVADEENRDVTNHREEYLIASSLYHIVSLLPFRTNLYASSSSASNGDLSFYIDEESLFIYLKILVLNLTNNLVGIACTTSILSYQFFLIGQAMQYLLDAKPATGRAARNNNNVNGGGGGGENELGNVGDVAAVLFFLLSVQSGLSSLHAKHRIEKFFKNYSLLFIAILHYFHTSLDGQLMTLSASSKLNWRAEKHFRTLSLSFALIVTPICILTYLARNYSMSTWFLAATAFNLELIVKMSVSLILYTLFSIEANQILATYERVNKKNDDDDISESVETAAITFSEKLDDYVYYVKAFGHIFEFFIALVLFFNGGYILFFESYGAIRAIMMCIHAYFHIWCQARKGWSAFMKRRTAISKLKQLAVFNKANFMSLMRRQRTTSSGSHEINNLDQSEESDAYEARTHDVCAICFSELRTHEARITSCQHIFHFICLRKWLYLQETCPMCHQLVCQPAAATTTTPAAAN